MTGIRHRELTRRHARIRWKLGRGHLPKIRHAGAAGSGLGGAAFRCRRTPIYQRVSAPEDIFDIQSVDDVAVLDVPVEVLDRLPLNNHEQGDRPRLRRLMWAVRLNGYSSLDPVGVRPGRPGR